ncbi:MAG: sodium:solute symporter family protein [Candidatus Paceibacterota bacterium]|jgi:SSS family solute:Na+ symporter
MSLSILFFSLYIIIVLIIGIISSKKETEEGFMIAERNVGSIQLSTSMSAGFFDGAVLTAYTGYVYQYGLSAAWLFVGFALGFIFLRRYSTRIKQKADELKVYSMPEYFYRLLGKRNGLMFSLFLITQFFLFLIIGLIASGKVLSGIFPIQYFISIFIGGVIILTYLLLAGFKAVVKTDFFQFLVMILMTLIVGIFLFGKVDFDSSNLNLTAIGVGNIISFVILGGLGIMVAPDIWQRMFAARDVKTLKRGLGYSAISLVLLGLVISVLGLATKQFFPNILPEDALVTGFKNLLPSTLEAFGMVLLYAVALSSADTVTFVISSIFTRDLQNYSTKYSQKSMKNLSRFFMVLLVFVAMLIAIFYQNIIHLGLALLSLNLALFPVVFGTLYWTLKRVAVFWSLMCAYVSVVVLFFLGNLTPETAIISLPVALFSLLIFQKILKG